MQYTGHENTQSLPTLDEMVADMKIHDSMPRFPAAYMCHPDYLEESIGKFPDFLPRRPTGMFFSGIPIFTSSDMARDGLLPLEELPTDGEIRAYVDFRLDRIYEPAEGGGGAG